MNSVDIAVLGGGISGLSLGYFLGHREFVIFEAENAVGGLCATDTKGGYRFDRGGHFLHFRYRETTRLLEGIADQLELVPFVRRSGIVIDGQIIPYPFQNNYRFFLKDADVFAGKFRKKHSAAACGNFSEWLRVHFDEPTVRQFMVPYNRKFWQENLSALDYGWAETFIPKVSAGLKRPRSAVGYNRVFFYPRGGMGRLPETLAACLRGNLLLNKRVVSVRLSNKTIAFADGTKVRYNVLVNSLPLPVFCALARLKTGSLRGTLRSTRVLILNCAVRSSCMRDWHWFYFPQRDLVFYRIGCYSPFLPTGRASVNTFYIEVSLSRGMSPKGIARRIFRDLMRIAFIPSPAAVAAYDEMVLDYAHPIPYRGSAQKVSALNRELSADGVFLIGRFGLWSYLSIEDCILSSYRVARRVCLPQHRQTA